MDEIDYRRAGICCYSIISSLARSRANRFAGPRRPSGPGGARFRYVEVRAVHHTRTSYSRSRYGEHGSFSADDESGVLSKRVKQVIGQMTTAVVQQSACQTLTSMEPRARTVHGGGSGTYVVLYARPLRCECDRDTGEKPHVRAPARGRPKPRLQSMTGRDYVVVPQIPGGHIQRIELAWLRQRSPASKKCRSTLSRSTRKPAGLSGTNNDCAP